MYINVNRRRDLCRSHDPHGLKTKQAFWVGSCCVPWYQTSHKALWTIILTSHVWMFIIHRPCFCAKLYYVAYSFIPYISPNECWISCPLLKLVIRHKWYFLCFCVVCGVCGCVTDSRCMYHSQISKCSLLCNNWLLTLKGLPVCSFILYLILIVLYDA